MPQPKRNKETDYLFEAILSLETVDDCYHFFEDLCTIKELAEMVKRMRAAKMLADNKVYTEITDATGLSTATISRVNRCLRYGSDGYAEALRRLEAKGVTLQYDDDGTEDGNA